jgi:GNAT superfamily N-acetyltransferase
MVAIRQASPGDCAALAALVQRYWALEGIDGFSRESTMKLLGTFLSHPQYGCCWVAGDSGRLCGYLLASYMFSLEHGGLMAEIDELYVLDDERSQGTGAALVQELVSDLKRSSFVRVQLQLGIGNDRGARFYSAHGFKPRSGYQLWDRGL